MPAWVPNAPACVLACDLASVGPCPCWGLSAQWSGRGAAGERPCLPGAGVPMVMKQTWGPPPPVCMQASRKARPAFLPPPYTQHLGRPQQVHLKHSPRAQLCMVMNYARLCTAHAHLMHMPGRRWPRCIIPMHDPQAGDFNIICLPRPSHTRHPASSPPSACQRLKHIRFTHGECRSTPHVQSCNVSHAPCAPPGAGGQAARPGKRCCDARGGSWGLVQPCTAGGGRQRCAGKWSLVTVHGSLLSSSQ